MTHPAERYLEKCRELVERVEAQTEAVRTAADWFAASILAGRMVHVFASGHSRIMVEEMWPRYGSFPGFNPMVELSLTFHNLGRRVERSAPGHVPGERERARGANPAELRRRGGRLGAHHLVERRQSCAHRDGRGLSPQGREGRVDRQPSPFRGDGHAPSRRGDVCRTRAISCSTPARRSATRW